MQFQNGVYQPYNPYTPYGAAQPMQYPQYAPQAPVQPSPLAQAAAQQIPQQQTQQPAQPQQTAQTQGYAYSNEIFVTSKEDALNRQVPFNSSVTYLHQDKRTRKVKKQSRRFGLLSVQTKSSKRRQRQ